jgi:predicted dienelactone hydrolase
VVFFAVFGFLAIAGSIASAANVDFETIQVSNGTEPPLPGGVWYPTAAPATEHSLGFLTQTVAVDAPISGHDLPLVVLSHGGGSSYEAHYDTALALAHAGFVAAAIDHVGDTVPVQLWRAAKDHHQADAWYDEAVRLALPRPPEYHLVAGANHYDFLPPCTPRFANRAPRICTDPPGFNRAAFHRAFDVQVVRFFQTTLH